MFLTRLPVQAERIRLPSAFVSPMFILPTDSMWSVFSCPVKRERAKNVSYEFVKVDTIGPRYSPDTWVIYRMNAIPFGL